jgi:hypothetical protein
VAVMIEDGGAPLKEKEQIMAAVARVVWQHYVR